MSHDTTKKKTTISKKFVKPSFAFLIEKKRDGGEFTDEEIRYVVDSVFDGEMPEYQLAALAMAIFFKGMSAQETAVFAEEMMGDKTSMILPALSAACGVVMPSMIGEEEDFIIGNLDKLKAIPGFRPEVTLKDFVHHVTKNNCALVLQPKDISPVSSIIYKLRQETATVPCLQLITGSVLSKKLAEGAEGLVADIKWGNGSFIKDLEQAKQLARSITRVARSMKRRCVALVTDMNQPLGDCVGSALEVKEAIALLKGEGPEDLKDLLLKLGMEVVRLAGVAGSTLSAKQTIIKHLKDGSALQKFKDMIAAQGGDVSFIDHPDKFAVAKHVRKLPAPKRGYVHTINAGMIARGVQILSERKDGSIDPIVGVSEIKKIGTQVKQGEPLMMIHYNDEAKLETALEYLRNAYRLAPKRPNPTPLVVERVA
ncbi:MAG: thymidine phosphorylase [Verrucomicrobia bacterium 21-51-4]|nr:MAG: thymidine phosphorylase [Verrucomicrobia bacterium 21-51-4]